MKISVILAHPNRKSFNHAIAEAVLKQNGHEIYFHDLYEEKFNPLSPAEEILKGAPSPLLHLRPFADRHFALEIHLFDFSRFFLPFVHTVLLYVAQGK